MKAVFAVHHILRFAYLVSEEIKVKYSKEILLA